MYVKFDIITKVKFKDVAIGDCFECMGRIYMKVCCNDVNKTEVNAMCLNDGYGIFFDVPKMSVHLIDNVELSGSL